MRKKLSVFLFICLVCLSLAGAQTIFAEGEAPQSSDPLSKSGATLEGTELPLPCEMKVLSDAGWETDEPKRVLEAGQTAFVQLHKGENQMGVLLASLALESRPLSECEIISLRVQEGKISSDSLILPEEIKLGSSKAELIAAYGETADVIDTDDVSVLNYSTLRGQIRFWVQKDKNLVEAIELNAAAEAYSRLTALQAAEGSDNTIRIGVFEPLSGAFGAAAEEILSGINLAQSQRPEVLGRKIELVQADNQSNAAEANSIVERLLAKNDISAVIGSYGSGLSLAAGPAFAEAKVPAVACSSTNPDVTRDNPYYFRVCFTDSFQGSILARFALDKFQAKTAATLTDVTSNYSLGLVKSFTESFKKANGDNALLSEGQYLSGAQDFSVQLEQIKAANPDVIVCPGNYSDSGFIIKQARAMGITAPILGGDTWDSADLITLAGDAANQDVYFVSHFSAELPANEEAKNFDKLYQEKVQKAPGSMAALGYDAYMLIVDAIERAGSAEPEAVQKALAEGQKFLGVSGEMTFDKYGDPHKQAVISSIKEGKIVALESVPAE